MSEEKKAPPVDRIRVGGVQAAIWKREAEGKVFYTASFELSYRDGEEYKTSISFGLRDCLNLAKAALLTHSAILKLRHAALAAETDADDENGE